MTEHTCLQSLLTLDFFFFNRRYSVCAVLSHIRLFAILWTEACQAPPSMGFSRLEYWSGLPCSPPGDLPNPGTEPRSPALEANSLPSEPPGKPQCPNVPSKKTLTVDYSRFDSSSKRHSTVISFEIKLSTILHTQEW